MKKLTILLFIFVLVSCTSIGERFPQADTGFSDIPIEETLVTLSDALTNLYPQTKTDDFFSRRKHEVSRHNLKSYNEYEFRYQPFRQLNH